MGNATGNNRKFGNTQPEDASSNSGAKAGTSKRIGVISGRIKRYTLGHNSGTGGQDQNGLKKDFGNAIPTEDPSNGMPSRGNKDGG